MGRGGKIMKSFIDKSSVEREERAGKVGESKLPEKEIKEDRIKK